jgi:hypothetical protein
MEPINPIGNLGDKFKRKFPMPQSSKEKAVFVIIIGLATALAAGFDPVRDGVDLATGSKSVGVLGAVAQTSAKSDLRLIGQYVFTDDKGVRRIAPSRRVRQYTDEMSNELTVVWPQGQPEMARAVGEFWDQLWIMLLGMVVTGFGMWWWRRAPRPGAD